MVEAGPVWAECTDPGEPGVDWRSCIFDRQVLRGVDLTGANLRDASFKRADLMGANLSKTNAFRAKFVSSQSSEVKFDGARLAEADLTKANLTGASFRNADLRRARLFRAILDGGLLVSESPPGASPLAHHFSRCNCIMAALARAVVVVEDAERSGALITARHALDLGREVLAVPGPIDAVQARV